MADQWIGNTLYRNGVAVATKYDPNSLGAKAVASGVASYYTPQAQQPQQQTQQQPQQQAQTGGFNDQIYNQYYAGWGRTEAEADWKATGGSKAANNISNISGASSTGGGSSWEDILKQSMALYQQSVQPQITALEAQKPQAETRYQQLLNDITRLTTKSTAQEFGKRGIPLDSTLYGQELAQATEPQIAQAGQTRTNELNNIINTIASLQSGASTGGANQAMNLYNAQQTQQNQQAQLALQQQQLAQQAKQNQYQTLGEGQTLFDTSTGKPYYTAPKTYAPGTGGGVTTNSAVNDLNNIYNSTYSKEALWSYLHNLEGNPSAGKVDWNRLWGIYNAIPEPKKTS